MKQAMSTRPVRTGCPNRLTRHAGVIRTAAAASVLAGLLLASPSRAEEGGGWLGGADSWAGRQALPAVVNPVVRSPLQTAVSLRGEWEFVTREVSPLRHPTWNAFFAKPWPSARTVQVPGCWEAQGVGEPGMGDSWDCKWDHCAKPLRHVYKGDAWYRKTVAIPESWRGQRVWLKIGGVRSQGWFWVNTTPVAWVDHYCGTYKYDVTDLVQAGKPATVVAEVSNVLPSRKGLFSAVHRFGGLYRDVELEATPDTRIDYAWVRGDFDGRTAEVHATLAWSEPRAMLSDPMLRIRVKTADGQLAGEGAEEIALGHKDKRAEAVCRVPLTLFQPWTPETPSLYHAELTLCDGTRPVHGWTERFGVRKLEVRGDRFFLNHAPFFFRGYGDDAVYPLTLMSPASREEHLKHLRTARASGFVYVRLHTHCELPEFFEAADEAGIMIQPELPYYGDYPTEAFAFDPLRDLEELITHYRRHVSLATYCMGNEGLLGRPLDHELYKLAKRLDPDRLVLHQDGTLNTAENSDYRSGPINVWPPGGFPCEAPFVAHEYLNLSVKLDPRLAPKFTGVLQPPVTLEMRDQWLAEAGLDRRWGDACQDAAHALQGYYQKQGIEAARMDPACDGYCFWTIVDVMVSQGRTYSAQGLLNAFWEAKSNGSTPETFRLFNGETVLLLKTEREPPVAVAGERLGLRLWISHYGPRRLERTRVIWTLRARETLLAGAVCEGGVVEPGAVRELAQVEIEIPGLKRPSHATLEVSIENTPIKNVWDFWVFPTRTTASGQGIAVSAPLREALRPLYRDLAEAGTPDAEKASLLISRFGSPDVAPALAAGKSVILINRTEGSPNVSLGWWWMGSQVGTAFARHPALGDFPHAGHLSPLAFRILKQGLRLPALSGLRPDEMFAVGEGGSSYFLYGAEGRVGAGRVLLTFGLDLLAGHPEGTCILDGLIAYARSDAFKPRGEVELAVHAQTGWRKTVTAGDSAEDNLPPGFWRLDVARAMKGKNVLAWETYPAPANVGERPTFTVSWNGGMGYFAQPEGSFALYVNDVKVIAIPTISEQDAVWSSPDEKVELRYTRDPSLPESGLFTLTLPSSLAAPGEPLRLKVIGSESNSRRWFGVYPGF